MKMITKERRGILNLALPAIAGLSAQLIVSLVDTAMVGRLDNAVESLAAMGIGLLATWAVVSFFSSLATGTHVLISRAFGDNDYKECNKVLSTSIILSIFLGVIVVFIFGFFANDIAQFFAADKNVGDLAGEYLFYRFLGIPFFLIAVSFRGFYFGIGKTKIFMYSGIITNVLNIFFNYVFIYGSFGLPAMGLAGAGLGSSIATIFDGAFYLGISQKKEYKDKYKIFTQYFFDRKIINDILKISLPVSFQNIFILIGFLSFIAITGLIGIEEQAASQTVISALFISLMPFFGFGITAQTLVGNSIGRGENKKAQFFGNETAKLATFYAIIIGIIFLIIPNWILLIFTTNDKIISIAVPLIRIAGIAQLFYGSGIVFAYGLQAAGRSFYVMTADVIINWLIFIPLAYFIAVYLGFGIIGAWASMMFYVVLYSFAMMIKFNLSRWRMEKFN